MMDIEMAKAFSSIVDEIEAGVKKLEDWHRYYSGEGTAFHSGALMEGYGTLMEGIGNNIASVRHNVLGLHMAQALLGLYGLASSMDDMRN